MRLGVFSFRSLNAVRDVNGELLTGTHSNSVPRHVSCPRTHFNIRRWRYTQTRPAQLRGKHVEIQRVFSCFNVNVDR